MASKIGFGVLTNTLTVNNSLYSNNWQCFHHPIHFLINFLKQNTGDTRDNRERNDPFLNLDCLLNHSQEVPMKAHHFNRHFRFETMDTDQFGKYRQNWMTGTNLAINRAGVCDWTKSKGGDRT